MTGVRTAVTVAAVILMTACSMIGSVGTSSTPVPATSPKATPNAGREGGDPEGAAAGISNATDAAPTAAPSVSSPPSTTLTCDLECATAVAEFDMELVSEASGLAQSRRNTNVLWIIDDGPGTTGLMVVDLRTVAQGPTTTAPGGTDLPTGELVEVVGLDGRDTEALATGDCAADDTNPCLFIADIGDNDRQRSDVTIYRLREPDLSDGLPRGPVPADAATFAYPDGPTDAEAMFALDGRLFIVSKAEFDERKRETGPTRLYEAPSFSSGTLVARGVVPVPRPATPLVENLVGNVVTGADAIADQVVLRTYDHAILFSSPQNASRDAPVDIASFITWPFAEVPTRGPVQTEAIALDQSTAPPCATFAVGEASGVVWRTPFPC